MDTPETIIRHVSLCSGYGGIDIGLRRVLPACRTIAYVEIEAFACANLVAKMEAGELDAAPIWTDLKTLPHEVFQSGVEIISGGFPCQPFSAAGNREADDDPRHLFPFIKNAIRTIQPGLVFLENVEGIISAKLKSDQWADPAGTPVLLHVIRELERVGYHATAGVFSASECGAPHQRKRVFICGVADPRCEHREVSPWWELSAEQITGGNGETRRAWPARPGESQHEWEEPRVVGNATGAELYDERKRAEGRTGITGSGEEPRVAGNADCTGSQERAREPSSAVQGINPASGAKDKRQTESELGGATDGFASGLDATSNRVDRLRLLGNGVVPATCEVAFRTLYAELVAQKSLTNKEKENTNDNNRNNK